MSSPFAKYQSEQVQQIAPGFVEGFGRAGAAIGQGIAAVGAGIAQGIEERDKQKKEEAKLQGMLSPYLKRDPRVQGVNNFLANGWLKKDDQGNVYLPEEFKDKFDPAKTADAISFYNQTGGDGSRLSGDGLAKFVTQFEADKKYEAEQSAKEAAALERRKTEAEIIKMNAEAAEKYGRAGIGATIGAFGSGVDMSAYAPPAVAMPSFTGVASAPPATAPSAPSFSSLLSTAPSISMGGNTLGAPLTSSSAFSLDRYVSGISLASDLKTPAPAKPIETTPNPVPNGIAPAAAPAAVTTPMPVNTATDATSQAYLTEIPKLQAARTELDNQWQKDMQMFSANYQVTLARITAQGATPEDIKALEATANTQYKLKADRYAANIASIDSRLKGFQAAATEARAAEENIRAGRTALATAKGAEREEIKFNVEFGAPGAPTASTAKTFGEKVEQKIQSAGVIPGRTGGTKSAEMRRAAQEEHTKIMEQFPTWYEVGLTTEGGNQYQFRLLDYPTAAPISSTVRAKVQEVVEGYSEGRVFLTNLLKAVEGTDEDRVRNYLDRFLATTSKDDVFAEGQALGQFGVAAFRRAIVSGGNFSDADREYVQKLITQINTANPFADKEFLRTQTKKLAEFIDAKFRSTLSANGVRLDMDTSEKFLRREDKDGSNAPAIENLDRAKEYYTAFGIDTKKVKTPGKPNEVLDADAVRKQIEAADRANNMRLKKALEQILKENIEQKEKARKKAEEDARRARGA